MKYAVLIVGILFASGLHAQWMRTGGPAAAMSFASMGDTLFAGAQEGLYASTDNGGTWSLIGFDSDWVNSLLVSNGTLFAGTLKHGLFTSTDNGVSWKSDSNGISPSIAIDVLCQSSSALIAGTTMGIFYSTNHGAEWQPTSVTAVAEPIATDGTIACAVAGDSALYYSTNGGMNWTRTGNFGYSYSLLLKSDTIVATANSGEGIVFSTDKGMNWVPIDSGLPLKPSFTGHALQLASGNIILGTNYGVYLLRPGSNVWDDATDDAHDRYGNPMFAHSLYILNGTVWSGGDDNVWFRPLQEILTQSSVAAAAVPSSVEIYPNPAQDNMTIDLSTLVGKWVRISLMNELGETVAHLFEGTVESSSISRNAAGIVPGCYECVIRTNAGTEMERILIAR